LFDAWCRKRLEELTALARAVGIEKGRRFSTGKELIRLTLLEYIICFVLIWTMPLWKR